MLFLSTSTIEMLSIEPLKLDWACKEILPFDEVLFKYCVYVPFSETFAPVALPPPFKSELTEPLT